MKALSIVLIVVLGGGGAHSVAWPAAERVYTFEADEENTLPAGFVSGMTGQWKPTEWKVRKVDGNKVLAHIGFWNEDPEAVFPICWVKDAKAKDLAVSVRLYPLRPPAGIKKAIHDGAGIIVRFKDPNNYYLLRAVPHEQRVRLYKVEDGKRTTFTGKNLAIPVDTWHELKLVVSGNAFTASFNGAELFTFKDDTFKDAGAFGLWSKPNNVTYFDDLRASVVNP